MKIAEINDPTKGDNVVTYVDQHGYDIIEFICNVKFSDLTSMINGCLKSARERGCVEVCFSQIKQDHMKDGNIWKITIYGFLPRK